MEFLKKIQASIKSFWNVFCTVVSLVYHNPIAGLCLPLILWTFWTRPKMDDPEYEQKLRAHIQKHANRFVKLAALTETTVDDKLANAVLAVTTNQQLWLIAIGVANQMRGVDTAPVIEENLSLFQRVKKRLIDNRFSVSNAIVEDNIEHDMMADSTEKTGSIATAIALVSIISAAVNIAQFIERWRNRNE